MEHSKSHDVHTNSAAGPIEAWSMLRFWRTTPEALLEGEVEKEMLLNLDNTLAVRTGITRGEFPPSPVDALP